MKKNSTYDIELSWEKKYGNWNFRDPSLPCLLTKPIAVIKLDNDKFVWKHQDILDLIKAYHEVDVESIKLIKSGNAGSVKTFETPLLEKIKNFIKELEQEEKGIIDHPFMKNGQKGLR